MANQEHLALIRQDVSIWNSWYKKHKKVTPDLSHANLSGVNLRGINLTKANLSHANLNRVDLSQAKLDHANLERANFLAADLRDASLKNANLDFVIFAQVKINSKTVISDKHRAVCQIVNGESGKKMLGIDLSNSNLFRADLSNVDLSNANLTNTNLNSANLQSAYLYRANLTKANLQNADLSNAYLSQANLTSTDLAKALCCGTYFKGAELKFANLKTTKLSHKTMIDLKWYSVWEIANRDAVRKNLSGLDLSYANLQGTNFTEANLTNANLSHTLLSHSNFDSANLTNTDFAGADIRGADLEHANLTKTKLKSALKSEAGNLAQVGSARGSGRVKSRTSRANQSSQTNLMVQERPTVVQDTAIQLPPPSKARRKSRKLSKPAGVKNQQKPQQKAKKKTNIVGLLFLGVIGCLVAGGYVFIDQNPEFDWQESWQGLKQELKQYIPSR